MLGEIVAGLIGKVFGFFGGSKIAIIVIGVLLASTAGAGYLLKQSYIENGMTTASAAQWEAASNHWSVAYQKQELKYEDLQQKLIEREIAYDDITDELDEMKIILGGIEDESGCLDVDLGDDFWVLLKDSGARSSNSGMHGD